jgi:Ran GTPase-activating protein (RanGAP) involved in mRNA processing and transport
MGDELGKIFAQSLDGMPYLEDLNVANNKLKDPGLEAIILALSRCHLIKSLNLSDNKVDTRASAALAKYLGSPACNLIRLILNSADVDDNEVDLFADAINHRKTIKYLDLETEVVRIITIFIMCINLIWQRKASGRF